MNPNSETINEITPRRTRRGRASESELVKPAGEKMSSYQLPKQPSSHRTYQMEFSLLKRQREIPHHLISSQIALEMLMDCYNIQLLKSDGENKYYLPNVCSTDESVLGRDYFESIQSMRENLCAYGLPPMAKGAKLSTAKLQDLESWIRCANISTLRDVSTNDVPQYVDVRPKDARKIFKGLGYTLSDNTQTYVLPGISMHKSKLGHDRFNTLSDLINHIARFGLDSSLMLDAQDLPFSEKERLELEVFVASVATFDVG